MAGWIELSMRALASIVAILPWARPLIAHEPRVPSEPSLARPETHQRTDVEPAAPPPANLVRALDGNPFGGDCVDVDHPFWPFGAKRCEYTIGARSFEVTTATPSADRVARWIVDASTLIPAVDALRDRDPSAWERCLGAAARYTMHQSGRSFPLDGDVFETFEGPVAYEFRGGVTFGTEDGPERTCGDCACRIDSLRRNEWCSYVADGLGPDGKAGASYAECMTSLGGDRGWNDAWASRCLQIHADAWEADRNDGYRALFHWIDVHLVGPKFADPRAAGASDVVAAVEQAFEYPHRAAR
jgi:hypothetical protein